MDYLKEFLHRDDIQEYLANDNLKDVYFTYCNERNSIVYAFELTQFFLKNNINPLLYTTQIFPYMYSDIHIQSIDIPSNIKEISDGAFEYCDSLTSITIPDSVTKIGSEAFYNCSSLTIKSSEDNEYVKNYCSLNNINWDRI